MHSVSWAQLVPPSPCSDRPTPPRKGLTPRKCLCWARCQPQNWGLSADSLPKSKGLSCTSHRDESQPERGASLSAALSLSKQVEARPELEWLPSAICAVSPRAPPGSSCLGHGCHSDSQGNTEPQIPHLCRCGRQHPPLGVLRIQATTRRKACLSYADTCQILHQNRSRCCYHLMKPSVLTIPQTCS